LALARSKWLHMDAMVVTEIFRFQSSSKIHLICWLLKFRLNRNRMIHSQTSMPNFFLYSARPDEKENGLLNWHSGLMHL
ncbi:MAG: hypothetical protein ACTSRA_04615, partial [Promethearchaeota archaeon]